MVRSPCPFALQSCAEGIGLLRNAVRYLA